MNESTVHGIYQRVGNESWVCHRHHMTFNLLLRVSLYSGSPGGFIPSTLTYRHKHVSFPTSLLLWVSLPWQQRSRRNLFLALDVCPLPLSRWLNNSRRTDELTAVQHQTLWSRQGCFIWKLFDIIRSDFFFPLVSVELEEKSKSLSSGLDSMFAAGFFTSEQTDAETQFGPTERMFSVSLRGEETFQK